MKNGVLSLTDRALECLQQHADEWVDWRDIARVAGGAAWRTRLSEIRKRGYVVENRTYRMPTRATLFDEVKVYVTKSEYRLVTKADQAQAS